MKSEANMTEREKLFMKNKQELQERMRIQKAEDKAEAKKLRKKWKDEEEIERKELRTQMKS